MTIKRLMAVLAFFCLLAACRQTSDMASTKPIKATELANRFFNEIISNQHNVALLDELLHPDFHSHQYPAPPGSDKAGFITAMKAFLNAFPDVQATVHDQIGQGDRVFTYFSVTGTHTGDFNGIAPTGKQVTIEGMDIWREQDGKIRENWVVMDAMGMMTQLGALPSMSAK